MIEKLSETENHILSPCYNIYISSIYTIMHQTIRDVHGLGCGMKTAHEYCPKLQLRVYIVKMELIFASM
jgi:hypothetical protein